MDLLAKHKATGAVNRMSEQVFAMNGGTEVYDIIDREGTDTFSQRSQTQPTTTETADSFEDRMKAASKAAGVIVASSTVVQEPGKMEAVAAAANSPFAALAIDGTPSTATPLQPGVKAVNLADLHNSNSIVGSTMFPNDASPEATKSARESQSPANQDQPQSTVAHNTLTVDDNGNATVKPAGAAEEKPAVEKKSETGQ